LGTEIGLFQTLGFTYKTGEAFFLKNLSLTRVCARFDDENNIKKIYFLYIFLFILFYLLVFACFFSSIACFLLVLIQALLVLIQALLVFCYVSY